MGQSRPQAADDALVALAHGRWHGLTGYAYLLTGDRAAAEDLVQEAFVRTFARRRAVQGGAVEGYVRRAILTIYIDGYRRRGRWRDRLHLLATPESVEGPCDRQADAAEVRDALAGLPRRQRACVVLRFYDELSIAEIATSLGIADGTVKRYLSMAMEHLEHALGPVEPGTTVETVLVKEETR